MDMSCNHTYQAQRSSFYRDGTEISHSYSIGTGKQYSVRQKKYPLKLFAIF